MDRTSCGLLLCMAHSAAKTRLHRRGGGTLSHAYVCPLPVHERFLHYLAANPGIACLNYAVAAKSRAPPIHGCPVWYANWRRGLVFVRKSRPPPSNWQHLTNGVLLRARCQAVREKMILTGPTNGLAAGVVSARISQFCSSGTIEGLLYMDLPGGLVVDTLACSYRGASFAQKSADNP